MNAAVAVNPASVVAQSAVVILSPEVEGNGSKYADKNTPCNVKLSKIIEGDSP
jgi:hypothetical protein